MSFIIHVNANNLVLFISWQSQHTTGLMYFLCGAVMLLSALCVIGVPETGKKSLTDTIDNKKRACVTGNDKQIVNVEKTRGGLEKSSHL